MFEIIIELKNVTFYNKKLVNFETLCLMKKKILRKMASKFDVEVSSVTPVKH